MAVVALMAQRPGAGQDLLDRVRRRGVRRARLRATRRASATATDHHEFVVQPDLVEIVPKLAWHYGEPFADSSSIPTFHLAELRARHVTVALTGDGGDESFAGYRRYAALRLRASYGRSPRGLQQAIAAAGRIVPTGGHAKSRVYDLGRLLRTAGQPVASAYASWFGFFEPDAPILIRTSRDRRPA